MREAKEQLICEDKVEFLGTDRSMFQFAPYLKIATAFSILACLLFSFSKDASAQFQITANGLEAISFYPNGNPKDIAHFYPPVDVYVSQWCCPQGVDCFPGSGNENQGYECGYWMTIPGGIDFTDAVPDIDCGFYENSSYGRIDWEPNNLGIVGSGSKVYCTNEKITLNAPPFYKSYIWYFKTHTLDWTPFSATIAASLSVNAQEIFGADFSTYMSDPVRNIQFKFTVSGCLPESNIITGYSFSANQIFATAYSSTKPTCAGGSDATVTITNLNRALLSGENLVTSLYAGNTVDGNNLPNTPLRGQANGTTIANLQAGTYYALIESNYGNCGAPVFVQVIVPPGPQSVLLVSASVTSNYNGAQIKCPTSTDGQITIVPSGGSAPYTYSVDGSSFVSTNVFTNNLGAGAHTINVKDACPTPATASTSVTINPPPTINISSVTPSVCNNGSNGQISITASGGTGTLFYSIDNGSTYFPNNNVFTGLASGNYLVKVKDSNDCVATYGSVTVPSAIVSGSVSIIHPTCTGTSSGSISITGVSGGTPGYSWQIFNLSNVAVSASTAVANAISVAAGTYYAKVTDANGCSVNTSNFVVNAPIAASYTSVPASCATVSDGSLTIVGVTGGNGSYTYSINNGAFGAGTTFSSLATGATYVLKVKDGNGCDFTINNAAVALKPAITGTISQTSFINCFGQSTASISVTPSGGTAPYTYTWSNSVTTQNNPNIPAGSYNVTITDSKTCTGTASISVSQPTALTVTPSATNISCKGGNNGSINLVVNGGTGTKTFLWSNGVTSQNISSLAPGTYSVAVTDANGCINNTASVTITEPATPVTVSLQSKSNVSCFGLSNGSILVTASGGTGTITYSKDGTNFQAGASFTGLAPGNYTITAKDANNCTQVTSAISITQPSAALAISGIIKNNPLCNGNANGSLVVSVTGGTAPYQYSIDGTNFLSSNTISGLSSGNYVVTVKDANNCTVVSASQSLVNPAALAATVTASPQSCSAIVDGRLTVSASGGTGTLQYSIDGTNFQTSSVFNGLLANNYTITIKDANNCSITRLATITTVSAISGTISQTAFINCFGQSTAALNLSVSGGTAPFTFLWSNGATSQNVSSLAAGNYSVVITDSKGCTGSASFLVTQPVTLSASTTTSNYNGFGVNCNGAATGFINLTVAGGTAPYFYTWSNGATAKDISGLTAGTYTVNIMDSKSCSTIASTTLTAPTTVTVALGSKTNVTCNGGTDGVVTLNATGGTGVYNYSKDGIVWQVSNTFTSLPQGSYSFLSRDQNNCNSPTPLAVSITQPAAITITFSGFQNANCGAADGSVQAIASGGTGALTYQWKDQANNVVGNSSTLSNVVSGSYTVTVTDQSLCSKTSATSVGSNGGAVFTVGSLVSTSCFNSTDGKAQVNISSGVGPFTITWSSGETGTSAIQLPGGSNSVTVKDAGNCSVSSTFTIPSPAAISLSVITKTSPDCVGGNNGSIQVTAVGGNGGYSYQWNGASGTNILSGIASGTYTLQIKDSKNCTLSQAITLNDPAPIAIATVNQITPSCASAADGSIQVSASGGNAGFTYSWNTGATGASINGLAAGTYTVTAKDAKNCTQVKSITLTAPSLLNLSIVNSTQVSCFAGANGSVTLSASGGTGTYEYSINGGSTWQTSPTFNGLAANTFTASTRDSNGCIGTTSVSITQPTVLSSTISSTINTTCGLANGSATVSGSGGTAPYTYQWFNAANQLVASNNTLQNASAGNYQVITTDANSCTFIKVVTIAPSANVSFSISNVTATKCSTSSDGSAVVSNVVGKAPYTHLWSSGETTIAATQLTAGTNTVKVTDADGCSFQQTFSVTSPSAISLIAETIFAPVCAGGNGSIQVTAAGGTAPYSFQWNGNSGTSIIQNIKAGNYQLIVNDANGCSFTKSFSMTDPPAFTIDLGPDKKICTGGTLTITSPIDAADYLWTSLAGFNKTGKQVTLTQPGVYKLRVTNNNGCIAEDSFELTTSNDLLKADFLMAPQAHVNDTIIVIDISWPLPDQITWSFPTEATVILQSQDYSSILFKKEGIYPVKLTAKLAECQSEYTASIEILKAGETGGGSGGGSMDLIKLLQAFPNPTAQGFINLKLELNEVAPVRVRLVSLEGNVIVTDFSDSGKDAYDFEITLQGVAPGVYFLLVDVKDQKRVVRIVII
ncbi:MAG: T9SS type A sorting domain-containing protein [Bacteroidetes bacterium]|nr:T9SS type A sorting domain-containing protein [Bacteroidota bacterium]